MEVFGLEPSVEEQEELQASDSLVSFDSTKERQPP
jgi:hypothetical protein